MKEKKVEFVDDVDLEELEEVEDNYPILCRCKPTYNFQSIEFDFMLTKDNRGDMYKLYKDLLFFLQTNAPEQDTCIRRAPKKKEKPKEPLASEKQKAIMDKYGIEYDDNTTQKEAYNLIKNSLDASK